MKALLDKTTAIFGAAALAFGLGAGSAALANETQTTDIEPQNISVQQDQQFASLSAEEALEVSAGRFLIHVGEGFSPTTLNALVSHLENAGLNVEVAAGGPEGQVTSYIYGNHYPADSYEENRSAELAAILVTIAQQNNLFAQVEVEGPENS